MKSRPQDLAANPGGDRFYTDLESFSSFAEFTDLDAYSAVPDDWFVMITDVHGSTKAIDAGRYKDVNMVGAASITAVLNSCGDIEIPFVFGGDGATLVVPGSLHKSASDALLRLQASSLALFGLSLRVGAIPVTELRLLGTDVRVHKFELSPGNFLAMISGGGVDRADALLKDPSPANPYILQASPDMSPPDLEGLSCRWEPLVPEHGRMMTLMIQPMASASANESALLTEIVKNISDILGHGLEASAPANRFSMRFRWPPRGLSLEARATRGGRGFWAHYGGLLLQSLIQFWCERFDTKAGSYDAPVYREELRANTDFRKFDGMLRTVLDVSADQVEAIETYLEREYRNGRLLYGMHVADSALMTCLVFSLEQGEHVHFIDGANGGFAMAATGFKRRVASTSPELDVRPMPSRVPAHPSITREQIALLVDRFYDRVRSHSRLGPVFENTIGGNWDPHLQKMKLFWASVLLRTGDYKGKPVPVHLQVREAEPEDFEIWLETFRPVAREIFEPEAAEIVIEAAERIAQSLWLAMFGSATSAPPAWMRRGR